MKGTPLLGSNRAEVTITPSFLQHNRMVHLSRDVCTRGDPGNGKPTHFCLDLQVESLRTSTIGPARRLFRPLSRYNPSSYRPALLRLLCGDGTSSILSLHMQVLHGETEREGLSACGDDTQRKWRRQ